MQYTFSFPKKEACKNTAHFTIHKTAFLSFSLFIFLIFPLPPSVLFRNSSLLIIPFRVLFYLNFGDGFYIFIFEGFCGGDDNILSVWFEAEKLIRYNNIICAFVANEFVMRRYDTIIHLFRSLFIIIFINIFTFSVECYQQMRPQLRKTSVCISWAILIFEVGVCISKFLL
ncbi:uncharacterized protein [Spinacia oleracea]|uniref:Uncharacterized protein n=1 Tax=Spinacia oleracea TaxID=3562 RepID=A0ABM3QHX7_SPIOL|nr:uncharacterized protein LOC110793317 [Spinacia oleracea]